MAHRSIVVIDDFYDDPDAIRRLALSLKFERRGAPSYPGGQAEAERDFTPEWKRLRDHIDEAVDATCPKPMAFPQGLFRLALAPDEKRLYVTEFYTGFLHAIDRQTGKVVDSWKGHTTDNLARNKQGWGMVDLVPLVDDADRTFIVNETDLVTQGAVKKYMFMVAPAQPVLKVTLVYNDPQGTPTAAHSSSAMAKASSKRPASYDSEKARANPARSVCDRAAIPGWSLAARANACAARGPSPSSTRASPRTCQTNAAARSTGTGASTPRYWS